VVECHAEGVIGRVITGGVPAVPGGTVFDKRVHLQDHADDPRRIVLFEPRGAVRHNANILVPSNDPRA
jgi:proline racemase